MIWHGNNIKTSSCAGETEARSSCDDVMMVLCPQSFTKGPWSLDDLAQELRGNGLRIVEVAPDGALSCRGSRDQPPKRLS